MNGTARKLILALVLAFCLPLGQSSAQTSQQTAAQAVKQITATFNVKQYGAKGDGVTNDRTAIQAALNAASASVTAAGQQGKVLIPPGVYLSAGELVVKSNTVVENRGHLKHTGGNAVGQFVVGRAASNVELFGGIWDSNSQQNDNTIAFGSVNADQSVAGPNCTDIWIHDLIVQNCKHGGSHITDINDPADVGRGGGKGITIQFGAKSVLISNVIVKNCDLGISFEGKETDDLWAESIHVENCIVQDAKYMGLFATSVPNTIAKYGRTTSVRINGLELVNCGNGQTTEASPRDIAGLFGAITCQGMVAISGRGIRIRTTSGKQTLFRGAQRHCDWEAKALVVGTLVDVINTAPYAGHNPSNLNSRYCEFDVRVSLIGDTFSGYWLNNDATYPLVQSSLNLRGIWTQANGTDKSFPTSQYCNNWQSSCEMKFFDMNSSRSFYANGGASLTSAASGQLTFLNGLGVLDSSGSNLTILRPTRALLSLQDTAGSSQGLIESGQLRVPNQLRLGGSTGPVIIQGAGSPEGAVTAPIGSLYLRSDGGAATSHYSKESGTGNTGWVAK